MDTQTLEAIGKAEKRVLRELGMVDTVKEESEGELLADLTPDEMKEFTSLRERGKEIDELQAEIKRLESFRNGKLLLFRAKHLMWWDFIKDKYSLTDKRGLHIDYNGMCIRKGIYGDR